MAMSRSTFAALGLAVVLAAAAGCTPKKAAVYEHENFDDSGTFSRSFPVSEAGSCEAARRALLSQGYIITSSDANQVSGNKSFQQNSENHLQISFNVTCAPDSGDEQHSTIFANALQDRYSLKKSNTSASLGVGILGSVSMPIGSSDDSMVKVASETVTAAQFYDRYFALVESYLPKPKKAEKVKKAQPQVEASKPQPAVPELGLPETAPVDPAQTAPRPDAGIAQSGAPAALQPTAQPATTAAPLSASDVQPAPQVDDSQGSQPVAPPAEAAPIQVQPQAPVESTAPSITPTTDATPAVTDPQH